MTARLLLLPGLLNDARLWQQQVAGLTGQVDARVGDLTRGESIAELARAVLQDAPAGKFALAGLSMGGYVALEIMRQAPERVCALALLDTSARPDTPEATEGRKRLVEEAKSDFSSVLAGLVPKMLRDRGPGRNPAADTFIAMASQAGSEVFRRQQQAIMGRIDSRPYLGLINCPTLVLCGKQDALTPPEVHEEMAAAIEGSRLVVIEDCGHLSPLEQPHQVTEALIRWLASAGIP